jgi:hypothetical protein
MNEPIFEHGGKSEEAFAELVDLHDDRQVSLLINDHADYAIKCLKQGHDWKAWRHSIWAFRQARELERRKLQK